MLCNKEGCRFPGKYHLENGCFCGYHKRGNNISSTTKSKALVLPRCEGHTKKGHRCKRNGTVFCLNKPYCTTHKPLEEVKDKIQEDCPICYNSLNCCGNLVMTHCGHLFHKDCIMIFHTCANQEEKIIQKLFKLVLIYNLYIV